MAVLENPLFTLIRLGLGTSTIEKESVSEILSFSKEQWVAIEEIAKTQGVSAIVLDGVQAIMDKLGPKCFKVTDISEFWKPFILQWIGTVEHVYEAGSIHQLIVIDELQKRWADVGLRMMVMKGMAMSTYYPNPKHRAPGDIDCYLFDGYAKGNEIAKSFADNVDEGWYKHSVINYKGETIENHQYFVHTREGKKSKRLNQELEKQLDNIEFDTLSSTGALLPPPMFNALFLTYHALAHFLEEGLRLKQILDWAMFLKQDADKVNWNEYYRLCEQYHFRRFAYLMTGLAVNYVGVELKHPLIVAESPYTEKVLSSTLYDNDYVFNGKGGWSNRWHILKNLIKYRWRYNEIYQRSIIAQVWYYVTGYLFKTE